MTSTMESTRTEVNLNPYDETDDGKDHKVHIVNPPLNLHIWQEGMSAKEVVDFARFNDLEVTALCGYTWVPKRNPEKHPNICDVCFKIAQGLMEEAGE